MNSSHIGYRYSALHAEWYVIHNCCTAMNDFNGFWYVIPHNCPHPEFLRMRLPTLFGTQKDISEYADYIVSLLLHLSWLALARSHQPLASNARNWDDMHRSIMYRCFLCYSNYYRPQSNINDHICLYICACTYNCVRVALYIYIYIQLTYFHFSDQSPDVLLLQWPPFNNMEYLWSQHQWVITTITKCGMKLLIHS